MSRPIREFADLLSQLPGIGPRQARRIVQFLLGKDQHYRSAFAHSFETIGAHIAQCSSCFRFDTIPKGGICPLCTDQKRESRTLIVVEKDVDIDGIENSGAYHGRYFVLGGLIPMARQRKNGVKPRTNKLIERIGKNGIEEAILALSTTPEGDYTAREILRELKLRYPNLKITLLGRGLSVGAEIEYADQETLRNALKNRL